MIVPENILVNKKIEIIKIPLLKRLFDVFFSLCLLILLSPFFFLVFVLIFVEHIFRGCPFASLFYTEIRITQGRQFKFSKFSLFKPSVIKKMRDEGVFIHTKYLEHDGTSNTIIGGILQKIYMDELPQLFSILKGDLSFVGPRPVNLEVFEGYLARGEDDKSVLIAGLTGMVQSYKGSRQVNGNLDQKYINFCRNNSSWKIVMRDIKIITRTIKVVFSAKGI